MAQVLRLGPRVGGRLALFCIHRVNRVYGALVVTLWACYGAVINCHIIIIIIIMLSVGREPDSRILEEMVAEAPGPINFTMFLGLFGDRLKGNCLLSMSPILLFC